MRVLTIVNFSKGAILLIDKKEGVTSFDVVRKIRKITQIKRVGHAGTLDMAASGLLIIALGKATKLISIFQELPKKYITEILFGKRTDTDDLTGNVISEVEFSTNMLSEKLPFLLENYQGEIEQIAPAYSALKINGKRSSDLARQGIIPKIKKRTISIYDISVLEIGVKSAIVSVYCSKGTYIRSIARDLGEDLKVGGTVKTLRRLSIGDFAVDKSVLYDNLSEENISENLISIEDALYMAERLTVSDDDKIRVLNGIVVEAIKSAMKVTYATIFSVEGELLAILTKEGDSISFLTVFH